LIEGTVWASTYKEYEELIKKGNQIAIVGKKLGEDSIAIEKIKPYAQWLVDRKIQLRKK
jgi:DNA polymerase-3 subunit alpha